ncbi:aldehyde dehydrogenase family protein [Streptomyces iranensis]|uniref:aldehyde dehydrogenase family protein n=1 Tax=Streptomyces iranensis TaxID=576784 RepID=UPI0039B736FF
MLVEAEDLTGGGPVVRSVDPQTGALLEPAYRYGGAEKTDRAAALAEVAFETYRHATVEHRAAFLETIARRITTSADQLLERAHLETALPVPRPSAETARTTGQLRLFADELGSACGHVYDPTGRVPTPCQLGPTCVNGGSRSVPSRSSALRTSRSPTRSRAVTPPPRSCATGDGLLAVPRTYPTADRDKPRTKQLRHVSRSHALPAAGDETTMLVTPYLCS